MPHLVTVSGGRIPLHRGQRYELGRGRECDIVLEDGACSRRHARLVVAKARDEVFLEDLKSHNGSFVNGVLVKGRVLVGDGARVRLGGSVFLARLEDDADDRLTETGTLMFEDAPANDVEAGEFSEIGLLGVLAHLRAEGRSVELRVALPEGEAVVHVRDGDVYAAAYDGLCGFNALVRLARQRAGIYWLTGWTDDSGDPVERNVTERSERLLAEIERCLGPAPVS